jgi:Fe-S-cluster containining protein
MIFEIGTLTPEEADSGKYKMYEDHMFSGYHHIKKHKPSWAPDWAKQGVCIYLGQDMKCTIYNNRPGFCRDFYCRENSKLTSRYLSNRRAVNNSDKWTEYEHEAFGHFLKEIGI